MCFTVKTDNLFWWLICSPLKQTKLDIINWLSGKVTNPRIIALQHFNNSLFSRLLLTMQRLQMKFTNVKSYHSNGPPVWRKKVSGFHCVSHRGKAGCGLHAQFHATFFVGDLYMFHSFMWKPQILFCTTLNNTFIVAWIIDESNEKYWTKKYTKNMNY